MIQLSVYISMKDSVEIKLENGLVIEEVMRLIWMSLLLMRMYLLKVVSGQNQIFKLWNVLHIINLQHGTFEMQNYSPMI